MTNPATILETIRRIDEQLARHAEDWNSLAIDIVFLAENDALPHEWRGHLEFAKAIVEKRLLPNWYTTDVVLSRLMLDISYADQEALWNYEPAALDVKQADGSVKKVGLERLNLAILQQCVKDGKILPPDEQIVAQPKEIGARPRLKGTKVAAILELSAKRRLENISTRTRYSQSQIQALALDYWMEAFEAGKIKLASVEVQGS